MDKAHGFDRGLFHYRRLMQLPLIKNHGPVFAVAPFNERAPLINYQTCCIQVVLFREMGLGYDRFMYPYARWIDR